MLGSDRHGGDNWGWLKAFGQSGCGHKDSIMRESMSSRGQCFGQRQTEGGGRGRQRLNSPGASGNILRRHGGLSGGLSFPSNKTVWTERCRISLVPERDHEKLDAEAGLCCK